MRILLVLVPLGAALTGCATDCQTACEKIWAENECGGTSADEEGRVIDPAVYDDASRESRIRECMQHCEGAMLKHGEPGSYEPSLVASQSATICLANDRQAAMWMECVDQADCASLAKNLCAPIYNVGACLCDGQKCD